MNVFVITDNKVWLDKAKILFNEKEVNADFYCSPKGKKLFLEEINLNKIKVLDVNKDYDYLISNYQLGFSLHCKQIFPKELVESVRCINIHPGFNPHNRGWFPQVFSIINNKPVGATIHLMDADIDHGDILYQKKIKIDEWDVSKDVYDKVVEAELALFYSNFDDLIRSNYNPIKMEGEGNYNSIQDYKFLLEIDLEKKVTMREAIQYLRAMTHPPYKNAYFKFDNKKIYVSLNLEKED